MPDLRLGDVIDDFCVKCRRLTNHSIVSILNSAAAKVRCRTCYSDHDYRNEQAPPSKKELARQKELYNAVLAGTAMPLDAAPSAQVAAAAQADPEIVPGVVEPPEDGAVPPAAKKAAKSNRKK
jgi:hypothetical protein